MLTYTYNQYLTDIGPGKPLDDLEARQAIKRTLLSAALPPRERIDEDNFGPQIISIAPLLQLVSVAYWTSQTTQAEPWKEVVADDLPNAYSDSYDEVLICLVLKAIHTMSTDLNVDNIKEQLKIWSEDNTIELDVELDNEALKNIGFYLKAISTEQNEPDNLMHCLTRLNAYYQAARLQLLSSEQAEQLRQPYIDRLLDENMQDALHDFLIQDDFKYAHYIHLLLSSDSASQQQLAEFALRAQLKITGNFIKKLTIDADDDAERVKTLLTAQAYAFSNEPQQALAIYQEYALKFDSLALKRAFEILTDNKPEAMELITTMVDACVAHELNEGVTDCLYVLSEQLFLFSGANAARCAQYLIENAAALFGDDAPVLTQAFCKQAVQEYQAGRMDAGTDIALHPYRLNALAETGEVSPEVLKAEYDLHLRQWNLFAAHHAYKRYLAAGGEAVDRGLERDMLQVADTRRRLQQPMFATQVKQAIGGEVDSLLLACFAYAALDDEQSEARFERIADFTEHMKDDSPQTLLHLTTCPFITDTVKTKLFRAMLDKAFEKNTKALIIDLKAFDILMHAAGGYNVDSLGSELLSRLKELVLEGWFDRVPDAQAQKLAQPAAPTTPAPAFPPASASSSLLMQAATAAPAPASTTASALAASSVLMHTPPSSPESSSEDITPPASPTPGAGVGDSD